MAPKALAAVRTAGQREAHISGAVPKCTRRPVQRLEQFGQVLVLGLPICSLKSGIDGLAFERQHTEHTLMHSSERFALYKPLQRFYAQSKFSQGQ